MDLLKMLDSQQHFDCSHEVPISAGVEHYAQLDTWPGRLAPANVHADSGDIALKAQSVLSPEQPKADEEAVGTHPEGPTNLRVPELK